MENNNPLVSVVVITYNSRRYVEATLESIKAQTYKNIELIVSDDCSPDNTVEFVKEWVEKNAEHFAGTKVVVAPKNSGIPANCNQGVKNSSGVWIKVIAGDDTLVDTCIADNLEYAQSNPEAKAIFSRAKAFDENGNIIENDYFADLFKLDTNNLSVEQQLQQMQRFMFVTPPTAFMSREICDKYNCNEKYFYMDDLPFYLTLLRNGIKLYTFDKHTVNWRQHSESIERTNDKQFYNTKFMDCRLEVYFAESFSYNIKHNPDMVVGRIGEELSYLFTRVVLGNRRNFINRVIYKIFNMIVKHGVKKNNQW